LGLPARELYATTSPTERAAIDRANLDRQKYDDEKRRSEEASSLMRSIADISTTRDKYNAASAAPARYDESGRQIAKEFPAEAAAIPHDELQRDRSLDLAPYSDLANVANFQKTYDGQEQDRRMKAISGLPSLSELSINNPFLRAQAETAATLGRFDSDKTTGGVVGSIKTQQEGIEKTNEQERGYQNNKALEGYKAGLTAQQKTTDFERDKVLAGMRNSVPAGGVVDPKQADNEMQLRKEFQQHAKNYTEMSRAYAKVNRGAQANTAAGDLSLIYAYMRLQDPASTVREGEFATAQNAGGVPERVLNLYNKALKGTRLTDSQRVDFSTQAKVLFDDAASEFDGQRAYYGNLAQQYGYSPDRIVGGFEEKKPEGLGKGSSPAPGTSATKGGTKYRIIEGK
jgi:hypothetical protein